MFKKGHKINVGRKNPNAGRKKSIKHQIQDAFQQLLPDCEAEVARLALNSESEKVRLEACQYIRDCVRGRPHQSTDQRIKGSIVFTADDYLLATQEWQRIEVEEQKLIAEHASVPVEHDLATNKTNPSENSGLGTQMSTNED